MFKGHKLAVSKSEVCIVWSSLDNTVSACHCSSLKLHFQYNHDSEALVNKK